MPSRCPNSRLIVANIVSRSGRLLTSARTARLPGPSVSLAACSDPSFKPQMATRAPSRSNSCAAASPIPLLPPVMRMFLSVSLPIVATPLDWTCVRPFAHLDVDKHLNVAEKVLLLCDFEDEPAKVLRLVIDNWEHPAKKEKVARLYRLDIKYQTASG